MSKTTSHYEVRHHLLSQHGNKVFTIVCSALSTCWNTTGMSTRCSAIATSHSRDMYVKRYMNASKYGDTTRKNDFFDAVTTILQIRQWAEHC